MPQINRPPIDGKLYLFNFSAWRMVLDEPFFAAEGNEVHSCNGLDDALAKGLDGESKIFIFGAVKYPKLERYAKENSISLYRVEDAFIRSVALGSSFTRPNSLIFDSRGLHFDPHKESDLEVLLQTHEFDDEILQRARQIREDIVKLHFSKYNYLKHEELHINKGNKDKIILITGQVGNDMSIKLGAYGLNNTDLIKMVREKNPNAYIIYKPHPDVLSGNRPGHVDKSITDKYVDEIQTLVSIDSCIRVSDEVHTLTSGAGFDALLRGKKVYTYGMPFYGGWGLTEDYRSCKRRTRKLSLDELVAGALLLYPVYISPKTGEFCDPERTLRELKEEQERYFGNIIYRYWINTRGYILPRGRRYLKRILKPFGIKV